MDANGPESNKQLRKSKHGVIILARPPEVYFCQTQWKNTAYSLVTTEKKHSTISYLYFRIFSRRTGISDMFVGGEYG
jgi:hypothetical protein